MNKFFTDYVKEGFNRVHNQIVYTDTNVDGEHEGDSVSIWYHRNTLDQSEEEIKKWGFDHCIFPSETDGVKKYYYTYLVHYAGTHDDPPSADDVESKEGYDSPEQALEALLHHIVDEKLEDLGMYYWEREQEEFFRENKDLI